MVQGSGAEVKGILRARPRAQIASEYLIIMGFMVAALTTLLIVYYSFAGQSSEEISATQISAVSKRVADAAQSVYYLGAPSQRTFKAYFPEGIESASLQNNEIVFFMRSDHGPVEIAEHASINITGSLPTEGGIYTITIKSLGTYVNVTYK